MASCYFLNCQRTVRSRLFGKKFSLFQQLSTVFRRKIIIPKAFYSVKRFLDASDGFLYNHFYQEKRTLQTFLRKELLCLTWYCCVMVKVNGTRIIGLPVGWMWVCQKKVKKKRGKRHVCCGKAVMLLTVLLPLC